MVNLEQSGDNRVEPSTLTSDDSIVTRSIVISGPEKGTESGGSIADASPRINSAMHVSNWRKPTCASPATNTPASFNPLSGAVLGLSCSMVEEPQFTRISPLLLRCRTLKPLLELSGRALTQTVHKLETCPCHGQVGFLLNGTTLLERYESLS
jgi:hypothetical protein